MLAEVWWWASMLEVNPNDSGNLTEGTFRYIYNIIYIIYIYYVYNYDTKKVKACNSDISTENIRKLCSNMFQPAKPSQ